MNDNVVMFPSRAGEMPASNLDEVYKNVQDARIVHAEEVIDDLLPIIYQAISQRGLLTDLTRLNDDDLGFIEESIRSALYRYSEVEHPLQEYVDILYEPCDEHPESDEN